MKKVILFLAIVFAAALVQAQSNNEEIELVQSVFGMEKKAIINEFVKVDAAQKDVFWQLYDEYEAKRKEIGKERITLLNEYAENYDKLNNETAAAWTKKVITMGGKANKLIVTYHKKISKAINPVVALQFFQVEEYILSGIRVSILEELPLPDVK